MSAFPKTMHRHHSYVDHVGTDHNHGSCSEHDHWAGGIHPEGTDLEVSTPANDPVGWRTLHVHSAAVEDSDECDVCGFLFCPDCHSTVGYDEKTFSYVHPEPHCWLSDMTGSRTGTLDEIEAMNIAHLKDEVQS